MTDDDMSSFSHNFEGYADPTASAALNGYVKDVEQPKIIEADERNNKLIKCMKNMVDLAGFDLLSRIELRERKTGRIYK